MTMIRAVGLKKPRAPLVTSVLAAVASFAFPQVLFAQSGEPPKAAVVRGTSDPGATDTPEDSRAALSAEDVCPSDDVCYDLKIRYVTGRIRNPNFPEGDPKGFDHVKLRSYVGDVEDEAGEPTEQIEFVAPQVELAPGDTFRLTLHNDLAGAQQMELPWFTESCAIAAPTHNDPHCANFNLTNMHTHGLWISPVGNSDNVLLTVNPSVAFTYEYNIPEDHPAGTFWYHAHRHGSTAPQAASGMAGSLIIRGEREPKLGPLGWAAKGDVDVLLPRPGPQDAVKSPPRFRERVMLFQQIVYACRWTAAEIEALTDDGDPLGQFAQRDRLYPGKIKTRWVENASGDPVESDWFCDPAAEDDIDEQAFDKLGATAVGRVGTVEPGPVIPERSLDDTFDQMAFNAWPQSRRHTAINGTVNKILAPTTTGKVERWRLIDAGVRQTIKLQIRKASSPSKAKAYFADAIARHDMRDRLDEVCSGEPLEVLGLATDGLTRPALDPRTDTWLQPGYREDILVSFSEAGTYCILNAPVAGADNINALEGEPAVLGMIEVTGPAVEGAAAERILAELQASANAPGTFADEAVRDQVVADLEDGGKLSGFVWHDTIPAEETDGQQTLAFRFGGGEFAIGEIRQDFLFGDGLSAENAFEYDPDRMDRILPLDGVDEWLLTSFGPAGHPFHIHVNPFEVVAVMKYLPDALHPDIDPLDMSTWQDVSVPGSQSEYAGFKNAWRDTLFVLPGHLARVRTRYQRYIGNFVLHCHILDHEDQGMMQNVRIAVRDGRGGLETHGH